LVLFSISEAQAVDPACDMDTTQASYSAGETVTISTFAISNPSPGAVAVEWKAWLKVPTLNPFGFVNHGSDGSYVLPTGYNADLGPIPLFAVNGIPSGIYTLGCRLRNPVTGALISEDLHTFTVESVQEPVPVNQFNIGDSIGEGEAANGTIGSINHQLVWSTGYAGGDGVNSINERFEVLDPAGYTENNATLDPTFNKAISGSVMLDFAPQAQAVAAEAAGTPSGEVGMVTVLLGNNDVCADTIPEMTDPALFEADYRAGLDVLANPPFTPDVNVQISSIPAIYWLWNSKHSNLLCRAIIWPFVPCQNLLDNPADDCASAASREDPDMVYAGDGANCQRRKEFHARIRDIYNPILSNVLDEYQANGQLLNADFVDVFDLQFYSNHVNNGDCFHPSTAGQAFMAEEGWCRSRWGMEDPLCTQ
jgi:lysophospholipase L1-like esterase